MSCELPVTVVPRWFNVPMKRIVFTVAGAGCALVLSACGGGDSPKDQTHQKVADACHEQVATHLKHPDAKSVKYMEEQVHEDGHNRYRVEGTVHNPGHLSGNELSQYHCVVDLNDDGSVGKVEAVVE